MSRVAILEVYVAILIWGGVYIGSTRNRRLGDLMFFAGFAVIPVFGILGID